MIEIMRILINNNCDPKDDYMVKCFFPMNTPNPIFPFFQSHKIISYVKTDDGSKNFVVFSLLSRNSKK